LAAPGAAPPANSWFQALCFLRRRQIPEQPLPTQDIVIDPITNVNMKLVYGENFFVKEGLIWRIRCA